MKRIEYFLDFQKLEEITDESYWFDERDKASFKYEFLKQTYLNKPAKKYQHPVMLYLGNKKYHIKYELKDVLTLIKNGATKIETEYYREHFNEFDTSILHQHFLNNFKSFTPCGIFYNRKSRIEIRQLNGIVMLQNLYHHLNSEQLNIIKNDKLTYALFRLLQPNRYAVLVRTKGMTSKNYKHFQNYIHSYYENLIKVNILKQIQINMIVHLSHDENIYINIGSDIVSRI